MCLLALVRFRLKQINKYSHAGYNKSLANPRTQLADLSNTFTTVLQETLTKSKSGGIQTQSTRLRSIRLNDGLRGWFVIESTNRAWCDRDITSKFSTYPFLYPLIATLFTQTWKIFHSKLSELWTGLSLFVLYTECHSIAVLTALLFTLSRSSEEGRKVIVSSIKFQFTQ